jgi:transposase-like protein
MATTVRYSEAFKLQVLRELREGKFPSIEAARRAYGIGGTVTIQRWMHQHDRTDQLGKVIRVETPKEVSEVNQLRHRVRDLEKALADAHLDTRIADARLKLACRAAGIDDVEAFKKKHDGTR